MLNKLITLALFGQDFELTKGAFRTHSVPMILLYLFYANQFLGLKAAGSGRILQGEAPCILIWKDFSGCHGQRVGTNWPCELKVENRLSCLERSEATLDACKCKIFAIELARMGVSWQSKGGETRERNCQEWQSFKSLFFYRWEMGMSNSGEIRPGSIAQWGYSLA